MVPQARRVLGMLVMNSADRLTQQNSWEHCSASGAFHLTQAVPVLVHAAHARTENTGETIPKQCICGLYSKRRSSYRVRVRVKEVIHTKAILAELSPDLSPIGHGPTLQHGLKHTPKRLHMNMKLMGNPGAGSTWKRHGPSHSSLPGTRDMYNHSINHDTPGININQVHHAGDSVPEAWTWSAQFA